MRCWHCRSKLHLDGILRDGILRGRDESEGGPYRLYTCPSCRRESRIESVGEGKYYASPAKDIGLVDWLVGWIEPLAPDDFLQLQEWQQKYGEERRMIFEQAGLRNYSGARWKQWVSKRSSAKTDFVSESGGTQKQSRVNESGPSSENSGPLPFHHPLHILGLERDAAPDQIRARFRVLVKQYHPDKHKDLDRSQVDQASEKLKALIKAYEKLEREGKV